MGRSVYLDSAATTLQKPKTVSRAMLHAVRTLASPGRGGHVAARRADAEAFMCRIAASRLLGVSDPSNIVFTASATHGLNIAIRALVGEGSRVVVSGFEHNSVTRPLKAVGADVSFARGALFDPESALFAIESRLDDADCVVVNHVSNVFGYILPLTRIAAACRDANVPLIVDASQSAGALPLDFDALGADFMAMAGHKGLYGPQGTGLLLCRAPTTGIIQGGTGSNSKLDTMPDFLPDALEAGTHNMPGIAGLRAGLEYVRARGTRSILSHERALITLAAQGLAVIPRVRVYAAPNSEHQAGVLSFTVDGMDVEYVGERLDGAGFAVRAGLHCAPEAHRTADTLESGTVRLSVSAFNTEREIRRFVKAVRKIAN
ncbi:MAG: aminotransferase class V-fold PLP-dependent enzyme [Oscillospiraceae bacterium]|jgi:selenocysteine lyase/cysteine desulfurase|nr:aminotransferase class V-fold PLP-dependent enzyme [Oscillospiraceae bacterium]